MIVQCQKCQTKFKLPDEKVPAGGTKVRCGKCGTTFRVTRATAKPGDAPAPTAPSPTSRDSGQKEPVQPAAARPLSGEKREFGAPPEAPAPRVRPTSKAFVPKNPFIDEHDAAPVPPAKATPAPRARPAVPAPAPARVAPAPQIPGEKREFNVPEVARTPSTIFGADKPTSPQIPQIPPTGEFTATPQAAPGDSSLFGSETAVFPMDDFGALMGDARAPAGAAQAPQAPGRGTAEYGTDIGPGFSDVPPVTPAHEGVAAPAASVIDALFENETRVVQHEALQGLPPQPQPGKRPISGEKKEFVVPVVPHGQDPVLPAPAPASPPRAGAGDGGDIDVDSLFSGLFVPDGHEPAPSPAPAPLQDAPFAGMDLEPDLGALQEMPVPDLGEQGTTDGEARWSDMGADLIGGSGIDHDRLAAAPAPAPAPAPSAADAAPTQAADAFNDDLAKTLQDEINRQFEMHFGESPGEMPEASVTFDGEAKPQPMGFDAGPPAAPVPQAGLPGTRQPITDNPFAAPFQVGIGTNDLGEPPAPAPLSPSMSFPSLAAPVSQPSVPNLDTFGQPPPGAPSNPFLQMPSPISSPGTMTTPPRPGSNDFLPSIPQAQSAPTPADPFAGFDLGAPAKPAPQTETAAPAPGQFAGADLPAAPGPGFGGGNDLFAQLESMDMDQGPGIGPQIEQLPVRQGDPDPAFAVTGSGFDLDQSGGAMFIQQQQAGTAKPPGAGSIDLHEGVLQQARPVLAKRTTSGVIVTAPAVAARKEGPKGPFAVAMPWVFTVLLLVAAIALLGLRDGKFAPGNIVANLTPSTAGSLNKYSIQGFKLYTVQSGKKVGVVTGNVKAGGAVNPAAIRIGFSLADHAGYVAFKGEFFPARPLTPEEIYELKSADEAAAMLSRRRLTTIDGRWIPFQAIFFDPPEHLERFAFHVEVSGVP